MEYYKKQLEDLQTRYQALRTKLSELESEKVQAARAGHVAESAREMKDLQEQLDVMEKTKEKWFGKYSTLKPKHEALKLEHTQMVERINDAVRILYDEAPQAVEQYPILKRCVALLNES
ncbi:hypothetical protein HK104_001536 [Borealophlyctis nickersoniae]|nr:hypothetical protein HK104_001536 [Borealophlyctis nickersoniae]